MRLSVTANQYTVKQDITVSGVGLHTGRNVNLTIKPANVDHGIKFVRTDLKPAKSIAAHMNKIVDTRLATTIGDGDAIVSTTEHLMAALHAFGIDNANIEIDSHEVPIMDGSSAVFMEHLRNAGKKKQDGFKKVLRVTKPIRFQSGDKTIEILPYDGFKVTGEIFFDDAIIQQQEFSLDFSGDVFANEVADARTFGYVEEVEELWANGLALGGTLDNVIAIHWNRASVLNEDGLRYKDEFIRHKVLDLIGDLALLGCPIMGHVKSFKTGHTEHRAFMETIADSSDCWEFCELESKSGVSVFGRAIDSTIAAAEGLLMPFLTPKPVMV
ncbi:MAG: UDP-3-O-acyl-N-acetylglucosamine deacetylase [Desulfotalea sp.]